MISDALERLRGFFVRTLRPALKNLFSARLNFINLFSAILILELLLAVILFSYANSLSVTSEISRDSEVLFSSFPTVDDDSREQARELLSSGLSVINAKSLRVFTVALILWLGLASFVFFKMLSSSVEVGRMVWGLYLTYGSDSRRLRRLLFWQLLTLGIMGLVPALPTAGLICLAVYGSYGGFHLSPWAILPVSAVTLMIFSLILRLIARRLAGKPCIYLLGDEGPGERISSPRRSSRRICADRPLFLAFAAVRRRLRHYLTTALCATLPLCLFFCCLSMAESGALRREGELGAFTLAFPEGFTSSDYVDLYRAELASLSGVTQSSVNGGGTASSFGLHLMPRKDELSSRAQSVSVYGGLASDRLLIICADEYSIDAINRLSVRGRAIYEPDAAPADEETDGLESTHASVIKPVKGKFQYVYPGEIGEPGDHHTVEYEPSFLPYLNEPVFFSYAGEDIPLEQKLADDRYGCVLTAEAPGRIAGDWDTIRGIYVGSCIKEEYIALHPDDFKAITGIDPSVNIAAGRPTPPVTADGAGTYYIAAEHCYADPSSAQYAAPTEIINSFSVAVADLYSIEHYGLDPELLGQQRVGEAIYVKSSGSAFAADPDWLLLSTPVTVKVNRHTEFLLSDTELLSRAVVEAQSYRRYGISTLLRSESLEQDLLLLTPEDYAALFSRPNPYSEIYLNIAADTAISELPRVLLDVSIWVNGDFPTASPMLRVSDSLWDVILTENGRYEPLLRVISVLLGLSVPFIWFYPQYNHYRRRRDEFFVLSAIGLSRRSSASVLLLESALISCLAAAIAALVCPIFNAVFYWLSVGFLELPFANSLFDPVSVVSSAVGGALCAGLTTSVSALMTLRKARC